MGCMMELNSAKSFTINASAEAFKILSNDLYSNKVRAVIRELVSNALDSHIEAINPCPVLVHLPCDKESWFSVKDNGTGMSDNDIMTLYTTFFKSTKDEKVEQIGKLGLGSKCPFCINDNFTVISRFNKVKRTYKCFIDKNKGPMISKLGQEDTIEHNGLEVKVDVASKYFSQFEKEAKYIFKFIDATPVFCKNKSVDIPKREILLKGSSWEIISRESSLYPYSYYGVNLTAIQANTPYEINNTIFKYDYEYRILIKSTKLDINFPNNSLSFTPSREELSYDDETKNAIFNKIKDIIDEIPILIQKKIDSAKSYWDACVTYNMIATKAFESKAAFKKIITLAKTDNNEIKFTWRDKVVSDIIKIEFPEGDLSTLRVFKKRPRSPGHSMSNIHKDSLTIVASNNIIFLHDDVGSGVVRRVRYELLKDEYENSTVYLYSGYYSDYKEIVHGATIIKASSLKIPPKTERKQTHFTNKIPVSAFKEFKRFGDSAYRYNKSTWVTVSSNEGLKDNAYYVLTHSGNIVDENNKILINLTSGGRSRFAYGPTTFINVTKFAVELEIFDNTTTVYSIPFHRRKILKETNLMPFMKVLKEEIIKFIDDDFKDYLSVRKNKDLNSTSIDRLYRILSKKINLIKKSSPIIALFAANKFLEERQDKANGILFIYKLFNIDIEIFKSRFDYEKIYEDIKNKYPLLNNLVNINQNGAVEYINLVEDMNAIRSNYNCSKKDKE